MNTELDYVIGKDAEQNTELILESEPHDVWFHLDGVPSAHLILRNPEEFSLQHLRSSGVIYQMALKLKAKGKYRKACNVTILYAQIKDVHVTDIPGRVTVSGKRNTLKA